MELSEIKPAFVKDPDQRIRVKTKIRNEVLLDPYVVSNGVLYEIESKSLGGGLWELHAVNYHVKKTI